MAQLAQQYDRVFDGVDLLELLDAQRGLPASTAITGDSDDIDPCAAVAAEGGLSTTRTEEEDKGEGEVVGEASPSGSGVCATGGTSDLHPHEWLIWRTGHYVALRSHDFKIQVCARVCVCISICVSMCVACVWGRLSSTTQPELD